jgi:hypothetical protein
VPFAVVIAVLLAVIVAVGLYLLTFLALLRTMFDLLQRWISHDISNKGKALPIAKERSGPSGTTSLAALPLSSPVPQPAAPPDPM